jgi:predicted transcriptional regulator
MGPLEQDIVELVTHNLATTNKSIKAWVETRYAVTDNTLRVALYRLAKRGYIRRIGRGVYRPPHKEDAMPGLDPTTRFALEALYSVLLSAVVQLARVLDKDCPVQTRAERRQMRDAVVK